MTELPPAYAHSRNALGRRQDLRAHLELVSAAAGTLAGAFGCAELAEAVGRWHDIGKYNPEWQRYLLGSEAGERARGSGPDHKGAGAVVAAGALELLAFIAAGHHGGLEDRAQLAGRVAAWKPEALRVLKHVPADLLTGSAPELPGGIYSPIQAEFLVRMLFSTLVDADFLDTERHFEPDRAVLRGREVSLPCLLERLDTFHGRLERRDGAVQAVRDAVYAACIERSQLPPGFFRLTVPTGGGKTLSSMALALRHAIHNGQRRVIVAVPYTSITEQTASVYRAAMGDASVLEHHSALDPTGIDDQTRAGLSARLAAQNWDAGIIVTTTVQLFESLFASGTSKCRKVHRLANSVIILDEAQALPPFLLAPILAGLRELVRGYGATVVLCTATQPALDDAPGFQGLPDVRELAPNPPELFSMLRRVEYELPGESESWSWEETADAMRSSRQALAITNTIADAQALLHALQDANALHLSTMLCGEHRRQVLREVRRRLSEGEPCRLVSTQVVEAGVDVDFPLVLRAMGPLDRIVQAAGRCNREGRLAVGRVIVFRPSEGGLPPGDYRTATDQAAVELRRVDADLHDPATYHRYFRALFDKLDLDRQHIQELRHALRFGEVATRFRMIQDDTTSVIVPYDGRARELLSGLRTGEEPDRAMFRAIQPYLVSVRTKRLEAYKRRGFVEELPAGLLAWLGVYDQQLGLTAEHDVLYI